LHENNLKKIEFHLECDGVTLAKRKVFVSNMKMEAISSSETL